MSFAIDPECIYEFDTVDRDGTGFISVDGEDIAAIRLWDIENRARPYGWPGRTRVRITLKNGEVITFSERAPIAQLRADLTREV